MATADYHHTTKCDSQDHFDEVVESAWAHLFALQPSYTKEEAESFAASCLRFETFLHYNAGFDLNDWYIRKSGHTVTFEHSLILLGSLCTKIHHPDLWSCVSKEWSSLLRKTPELGYQLTNNNLWKIHQENFACRFMQVATMSDFFQDLGIKKSKLLKPISKTPAWSALNIALMHDCATLEKGFSTELAADCLGLILCKHPLPAYLEDLVQDDVLETIARTIIARMLVSSFNMSMSVSRSSACVAAGNSLMERVHILTLGLFGALMFLIRLPLTALTSMTTRISSTNLEHPTSMTGSMMATLTTTT